MPSDDGAVLIQVGRTSDAGDWRLPWRPEWRIVACGDCGHDSWISPKGRAIQEQYPGARVVCSRCWPVDRIDAETDEVTVL